MGNSKINLVKTDEHEIGGPMSICYYIYLNLMNDDKVMETVSDILFFFDHFEIKELAGWLKG